jgi:hypothetical protein
VQDVYRTMSSSSSIRGCALSQLQVCAACHRCACAALPPRCYKCAACHRCARLTCMSCPVEAACLLHGSHPLDTHPPAKHTTVSSNSRSAQPVPHSWCIGSRQCSCKARVAGHFS